MSNANLTRRIESLLRALESGEISLKVFAREFEAHFESLEKMEYSSTKAAQMAAVGFDIDGQYDADGFGDHDQFVADTVVWVRGWLKSIPQ